MYDVLVLAGGRSTRLGRPKHLLIVEGEPLVRRVVRRLGGRAVVCASSGTARDVERVLSDMDVQVVLDSVEGMGPVGGMASGLAACTREWAAVCGCDMPFVSREVLDALYARREGVDAVIPVCGKRQTLHALYRRESVLAACELLLRRGGGSVLDALSGLSVRYVPVEEERCFFGIDTVSDLIHI
ncbi:molybdenum cofactor guanylyltransferase [Methermicoccus shengliensis]|uniref:Molybdenum cofactor guanylyltransferase n=1 Tax=Methermicoccus shengliensis TaxID=660064 RepID=A0A832RY69_9EURY|nr:molybdenum cofactor guanylyltransferase [Methermicoccus shengliensis]KUK04289.1 MAG: putative molybdenum cofactor guanylyltransferase [Euryarchaeota archaeon 55_53]KUK30077.1 MAG: putative molybdenum cofactor guanylyltransferase [Methanosarcinales archeaon 56_1174]MDI3487508.1 hypothetical protein [Methanosarcinales archaeon]MDN5295165.1 hypothetical protein [Methanosarcinales archaeon]HIH70418.1 molybdenum cofactor guanylyltransferase [Methermicoccus shengliensis]